MKWEYIEKNEPDYRLMVEEATDELLESCGFDIMWRPMDNRMIYDEGLWDSIKSGWNKLTGKEPEQPA